MTRVGFSGWSHSGDSLARALTDSPYLFAVASDGGEATGGYFSYLAEDSAGNFDPILAFGGQPAGANWQRWFDGLPAFHLDSVKTPVRLVTLSTTYLSAQWDWYKGLLYRGKPVELVMFDDAMHELVKPAERMAISGGNVDWFSFWLQGYEDPDPTKTKQYARWEKLCDEQVTQNPETPSHCVRAQSR